MLPAELARRLTDVERRVAILEGAVPRCGAFTPEENLAAAWVYKLSSLGLDLTVTFLVDVTHDRWTSPREKALTDISDASEGDNAR